MLIEWFLSLFKKDNEDDIVIVEPTDDSHIIILEDGDDADNNTDSGNTYIINENSTMEMQKILNIELVRIYICKDYTIGKLYVNGDLFSDTIEDADRGLTSEMSLDEIKKIKIYGETAIPLGTYDVRMTYSPKFSTRVWGKRYNGYVPQIMNVKGFDGIRIHPLNTAADSLGCIGPGRNLEKGKVLYSTDYYYKLLDEYILPASDKGYRVIITISRKKN